MERDSDINVLGMDPQELQEWVESFDQVVREEGRETAITLLDRLRGRAHSLGIALPFTANTPYVNTISSDVQPIFPGDQEIERRIKSLVRWNALAMVVRAGSFPAASWTGGLPETSAHIHLEKRAPGGKPCRPRILRCVRERNG